MDHFAAFGGRASRTDLSVERRELGRAAARHRPAKLGRPL